MANELKVLLYTTGIIATGYALMKTTVPDEEALKKRLDPRMLKEYEEKQSKSRQQKQHLLSLMQQAAESDKPAWEIANEIVASEQQKEQNK
ncbi:hypothetical protein BDF20DRAFT_59567 [Mycotypha africana]|uniref:uncharacterized protein n=1 Tax=Mycotypha africana TaxID=64632 RepID=UPI0023008D33|nr:uncharacterized protein BDF20DRAFT_59567 [Mycotypha africana]KAI8991747.1 hypothetical protein BDF20DRAFT_59567 [Mycotypha africana]